MPADDPLHTRLAAAGVRAHRTLPPAVAELVADEIDTWLDVGWRFGGHALMARLADTLLRTPHRKEPDHA